MFITVSLFDMYIEVRLTGNAIYILTGCF